RAIIKTLMRRLFGLPVLLACISPLDEVGEDEVVVQETTTSPYDGDDNIADKHPQFDALLQTTETFSPRGCGSCRSAEGPSSQQQRSAGHRSRLGEADELEHRRRDVADASAVADARAGIAVIDVKKRHRVGGVRRVRLARFGVA